jgi:uncharacterized protein
MRGRSFKASVPALLATAVGLVTAHLASQPILAGTPRLWFLLLLAELPLGGLGLLVLYRKRRLCPLLAPKRGDVTVGFLAAVALTVATWAGRAFLTPNATPRQAWLLRLYLQMGDPIKLELLWWTHLVIILGACLNEIVWRGTVQPGLAEKFGAPRGLLLTSTLYALSTIPTAIALRDPTAGMNPIVPLTALAGGLLFGHITNLTGRLGPAIVAHATFSYFTVMQFRPGL